MLSLLLIDIDFFKDYNDNYGHEQGDVALRGVADSIRSSLPRFADLVFRYGGEEFAVLLPGIGEHDALTAANLIIETVRRRDIEHAFSRIAGHLTVSIGVASMSHARGDAEARSLFRRADGALYLAKRRGRDRAEGFVAEESSTSAC